MVAHRGLLLRLNDWVLVLTYIYIYIYKAFVPQERMETTIFDTIRSRTGRRNPLIYSQRENNVMIVIRFR